MTLTLNEKRDLLNTTIQLLTEHNENDFSSREILIALNNNLVSPTVLTNIIVNYIGSNNNAELIINSTKPYRFKMVALDERISVASYEKVKNLITFYNEDKTKSFSYDFNNNEYLANGYKIINTNNEDIETLMKILKHYDVREWLFSYLDLLDDMSTLTSIKEDCPKGYINWLKANNLRLNDETMRIYKASCVLPKLNYRQLKNVLNIYRNEEYILNHADLLPKICKMTNNSLKNYDFSALDNVRYYIRELIGYMQDLNNDMSLLDDNRDMEYNVNFLRSYKERERNNLLANKLQTLNFLNGYIDNDYMVVVPQTIEDLNNESNQQNNCVRYYYNDSIIRGENLIYFLRKVNNPKKSVVTCRYNIKSHKTVEHRIVNNNYTNSTQESIIERIDTIINEHFK